MQQQQQQHKPKLKMADWALFAGVTLAFIYFIIRILELPEKK